MLRATAMPALRAAAAACGAPSYAVVYQAARTLSAALTSRASVSATMSPTAAWRSFSSSTMSAAGAPQQPAVEMHQGLKKEAVLSSVAKEYSYELAYSPEYCESIKPTHKAPTRLRETLAYHAIQLTRRSFDWVTGYSHDKPQTEGHWLRRMIFLESVAGVPGMCAGMLRHLRSLRTLQRDHGWIHTLLEEAENERMHLLTFMELRKPGLMFRGMVILTQGVFFNVYFISYILSPKFCHAVVGYLEEEAVKTYTHALHDIESGKIWKDTLAPPIAVDYWKLPEKATMRDLILAVRADEACHSHVNHHLSVMKPNDDNPFVKSNSADTA